MLTVSLRWSLRPYVLAVLTPLRNLVRWPTSVLTPLGLLSTLGLLNPLPILLHLPRALITPRMFLRMILPIAPFGLSPGLRLRHLMEHLGENIILFRHLPLMLVTTPSNADPLELPKLTTLTPVLQKKDRQTPPNIRPRGGKIPSMFITEKTTPPLLVTP